MDFFNLNKAKVIVFCTSSAIFLVPLAAFGGEQLNSRTDRVSNIASKQYVFPCVLEAAPVVFRMGGTAIKDARTRTAALSTQSYWGILEAEQLDLQ